MTDRRAERLLDVTGPGAPPRHNGELVFAAPWESRLFGMTLALSEAGAFEWEEFRRRLMAEIAEWEQRHDPGVEWSYYACWRTALEKLLGEKGLCGVAEIDTRARELAARPAGHDH